MRVEKKGCSILGGRSTKMLASSIRRSLIAMQVACAMGGLAFAGGALAQTDTASPPVDTTTTKAPAKKDPAQDSTQPGTPDKAVVLKQVSVTGSNIRSVDVEAAQPVITITAQDIQRQGFATVGQIL